MEGKDRGDQSAQIRKTMSGFSFAKDTMAAGVDNKNGMRVWNEKDSTI